MKGIITSFKMLLICTIYVLLFKNVYVAASENSNTNFKRSFVVRQEIVGIKGVFVCRPHPVDEKIMNIISNNAISSFEDYIHWLKENIKYESDNWRDCWSMPEETLRRKYGDCEDYAFLNAAFLSVFGYDPKVLAVTKPEGIHAICVFEENGYYCWIDNTDLRRSSAQSMLEFSKYIFEEYHGYYLLKPNFKNRKWDVFFGDGE